jgi:SNF2 family DNA or RNA helicase
MHDAGDDMGLGKTMQCSAFLSGMIKSKLARCVPLPMRDSLSVHSFKASHIVVH